MKYVLVEWESDSTISVVPAKRLKTRDGKCVTQAWPGGVIAGSILQESDRYPNVSKGCARMHAFGNNFVLGVHTWVPQD